MSIRAEIVSNPLDALIARTRDPSLPLRAGVKAWRAVIESEFDQEHWQAAGGAARPWLPVKPFGSRLRPPKVLWRDGALKAAWTAGGVGSFERYSRTAADFGVLGSVIPYAAVHRGGAGEVRVGTAKSTTIKPVKLARGHESDPSPRKWAMWWFLGMRYGVWLSAKTLARGLKIPARPHATRSAELVTRLTAIFSAWGAGRQIPEHLTRAA